ncbi:TonB-dependent receptor [Maribellus sediminis]|uniref:TonB-dependent receptor n=1 Tax=Maribellus sediminis TaxID=2696285 RepID=UPI00142FA1FC|nr:TonB-dependent receptor [Maribellus sediminis]
MKKIVLIAILVLVALIQSVAQNEKITLNVSNESFENIIYGLEEQTGYHFYYNPEWVDSLLFTVNINEGSLNEILDKLCQPRNLSFAIMAGKRIVFTKDYKLKTDFAAAYIDYLDNKQIAPSDTVYGLPRSKKENPQDSEFKVYTIGSPSVNPRSKTATLQGTIKDADSGEPLVGATVYIEELKLGTACNTYGYYTITIPKGQYKVEYRQIGMRTVQRNIIIHSDGKLNVELEYKPEALNEVIVVAKEENNVKTVRMGVEKISMKTLKQLPMGFGEADIIKSSLLLPGVQSVGEASSGFNVRGGSVDQNLILLNDASILNTSHFFGFFSGFNSELVKDITLYKSGIPAKYGGRVSSVMDITLKDGNRKKTEFGGGISPVSGRLNLEGPIVKDKSSFIIGARSTYSNWILGLLDDEKLKNSSAGFYDVQGNVSFDINPNNSLYLSGYLSHDAFDYYAEDAFEYQSFASTFRWKHIFSPRLFSTFTGVVSNYDYTMKSRTDSTQLNNVQYKILQKTFKADFTYHTANNHKIDFGLNSTWYDLYPGNQWPVGSTSLITEKAIEKEQALESALYIGDEFDLNGRISLAAGFRYNFYANFGPKTQVNYLAGIPRNEASIIDTTHFSKNEVVQFYSAPEIRFSANIKLGLDNSLKIGANRMYQYIHLMSNTMAMSPTDVWKLSDSYLKPQRGDQLSIGFYHNMRQNTIEASIETYYKKLDNILDYKGGAQLVMNDHLETDVINGKGKAYGIELMLQKKKGKYTGWINYTYSRILHKIDSEFEEERVNNGEYFPANYDMPHNFKLVFNYKYSRRFNLSANFLYNTGRPYTAPVAYYYFNDAMRVYYSDRNAVRMDDYIRLDVAANINGNLLRKKLNHSSWTFAVYNVFGRKNPYSIFFRTENEQVKGYKMSIFGQPIFTVTYNFKLFGNAKNDF